MKNNNFLTIHFRKENGVFFLQKKKNGEMEYLLREADMALAFFLWRFMTPAIISN